jgi:hypothetical protein
LPKIIDQFVRYDTAAPGERLESVNGLLCPFCGSVAGSCQGKAREIGKDGAHRSAFPPRSLLSRLQNVIRDIQSRSHLMFDDNTSTSWLA